LANIVNDLIEHYGFERTPEILDKIKDFGYKYVTRSGITWSLDEVKVPEEKKDIIARAKAKAEEIMRQYEDGLLSEEERTICLIQALAVRSHRLFRWQV